VLRLGVTIGKFLPFHSGHRHLIEVAAAQVAHLVVIVAEHPEQSISGDARARWIREEHPDVEVLVTADDLPEEPGPWAARTLELLGGRVPDVAFTSEDYGDEWARLMGCAHRAVDVARMRFAVSGTMLREDLDGRWELLAPSTRAGLARRVVIAGAESTGKTTLAAALARRFATVWVPEVGRQYWEGRRFVEASSWDEREFVAIVAGQVTLEDALARLAQRIVIADTDALVTCVWAWRYLGRVPDTLLKLASVRAPDITLVCAPDIPWEQDGTRESLTERERMHELTVTLAHRVGRPFVVVSGAGEERTESAVRAIEPLLAGPVLRDARREVR
jgi:HTH-type transcriptional repressor of NAD biosynthesis genes